MTGAYCWYRGCEAVAYDHACADHNPDALCPHGFYPEGCGDCPDVPYDEGCVCMNCGAVRSMAWLGKPHNCHRNEDGTYEEGGTFQ